VIQELEEPFLLKGRVPYLGVKQFSNYDKMDIEGYILGQIKPLRLDLDNRLGWSYESLQTS
jgi:hypothetical protein